MARAGVVPAPALGPARLEWEHHAETDVWQVKTITQRGYSRRALTYEDHAFFATIRPAPDGFMFSPDDRGYVVTRSGFDEWRVFPTIGAAKVYVESLFALEHS